MNRNVNSHFATLPKADIKRSRFDRSSSVKLTFNTGDLIPFYVDEVLPGDTFSVDTSKVVRMQTLISPIMDNVYLDTYYFYVPNRLVWSHWREMNGENTASPWVQQATYNVPQLESPSGGWNVGTIADYMGIPTGVGNISVNALPFRAYALICNEWFRSENVDDPLNVTVSDSTQTGVNTGTFVSDVELGGLPYKANKYFDYFTGCLPYPQKGPDVMLPVGASKYPVYALNEQIPDDWDYYAIAKYGGTSAWKESYQGANLAGRGDNTWPNAKTSFDAVVQDGKIEQGTVKISNSNSDDFNYRSELVNLWAVNDGSVAAATINQLRLAFQIQKLYEKDARGGTRYIEILKSHFGVTSPDSRLQRPEYLGGNRIPININQVIQNSATDQSEYLGDVAAMSVTSDHHSDFTHSFVEHGFVIGILVARYDHTYQQGIERFWSRKDRFDYYWPVFANIGEQAVLNKEIYAQGTSVTDPLTGEYVDDQVFGYQEAWADYRYKPNRVCGEMRSTYATSLDVWHLGDDYSQLPALSPSWLFEDKSNVDRVLRVTSSTSNQFFADIYVRNKSTRPMPVYSVPGLIDHH